ncbi:DMT family protein [Sandarakinorhabdus oryzae]|uniref:DMT family protein n=1 Tax=Sandarakinorhabdus oryzae TaxID=2675220 RepID=UPI0018CBF993|nr:DMT family protein [Sandarakinorhabdus oryzae]
MPPALVTALMLTLSNIFMTFAWYGHLKHKAAPLAAVVMISWGIAFFEYWLAVPANRIGSAALTAPQLKGMQEIISILVFAVFSYFWLGQPVTPRQALGFALIIAAAFLIVEK